MHWVGGGVKSKTSQVVCEFICVNVVVFLKLFLVLCYYCSAKKASYMSVYVRVKQLSLFLIKFSGIGIGIGTLLDPLPSKLLAYKYC